MADETEITNQKGADHDPGPNESSDMFEGIEPSSGIEEIRSLLRAGPSQDSELLARIPDIDDLPLLVEVLQTGREPLMVAVMENGCAANSEALITLAIETGSEAVALAAISNPLTDLSTLQQVAEKGIPESIRAVYDQRVSDLASSDMAFDGASFGDPDYSPTPGAELESSGTTPGMGGRVVEFPSGPERSQTPAPAKDGGLSVPASPVAANDHAMGVDVQSSSDEPAPAGDYDPGALPEHGESAYIDAPDGVASDYGDIGGPDLGAEHPNAPSSISDPFGELDDVDDEDVKLDDSEMTPEALELAERLAKARKSGQSPDDDEEPGQTAVQISGIAAMAWALKNVIGSVGSAMANTIRGRAEAPEPIDQTAFMSSTRDTLLQSIQTDLDIIRKDVMRDALYEIGRDIETGKVRNVAPERRSELWGEHLYERLSQIQSSPEYLALSTRISDLSAQFAALPDTNDVLEQTLARWRKDCQVDVDKLVGSEGPGLTEDSDKRMYGAALLDFVNRLGSSFRDVFRAGPSPAQASVTMG